MDTRQGVSRRQVLAMSAAAGSIAIGGGYRLAAAQAAKRIDKFDPALDQIVSASEPIVDLATNLGGVANVEGPLWWKEGGYLLFRGTDNKRWKYAPGQALSVFKENTNAANGITRDMQGRLVACEAATRRIVREERDGSITVLASSFQGRPLQPAERYRGEIGRRDLFHRPLDRGGSARRDRPGLCRRVPHIARPRHAHAPGR